MQHAYFLANYMDSKLAADKRTVLKFLENSKSTGQRELNCNFTSKKFRAANLGFGIGVLGHGISNSILLFFGEILPLLSNVCIGLESQCMWSREML